MKYRRTSHSDNRIPPSRRTRPLAFTYEGARIDGIVRNSEYGDSTRGAAMMIRIPAAGSSAVLRVMMGINLRDY